MIEHFYSKVKPGLLLHMVIRPSKSLPGRIDVVNEYEFLQCAVLNVKRGTTYQAHKHIIKEGPDRIIAQESWVCLKGSVKCKFYDVDDRLLAEPVINAGDFSVTLSGGHTYEILGDALILEFKNGPYTGQLNDKVFI